MNADPSGPSGHAAELPERLALLLSAMADGEAQAGEADLACQAWRDEAGAREAWHSYQLIGDVLRSEDLAHGASGDAAFLRRLRTRLADEPVVLAPMPVTEAAGEAAPRVQVAGGRWAAVGRRWRAPAAMAAGVLAVAGAAVMVRQPGAPAGAPAMLAAASAVAPAVPVARVAQVEANGVAAEPAGGVVLVRDAQLDRYLAAHRQYAGRSLMAPSDGLRQVAVMPLDH